MNKKMLINRPLLMLVSTIFLCAYAAGAESKGSPEGTPENTLTKIVDTTPHTSFKRMKILVATDFFPKRSETFVLNQIKWFLARGHDVHVYARKPEKDVTELELVTYSKLFKTYYGGIPSDIDSFDIILCQFGTMGNTFVQMRKRKPFKAKIATIFRGFDITRKVANKNVYVDLFNLGDLFLPICDVFKNRILSLGGPAEKVTVHYDAIDCAKFSFNSDNKKTDTIINIISVARLIEKKGLEDAIKAIALVIKRFPQVRYTIIGTGPLLKKLKTLTAELQISSHVVFAGWQSHDSVVQFLLNADIYVLPCVRAKDFDEDGTPNSIIEAMACGLPVISTTISGIPEVVSPNLSGFLINEHQVEELATKMEYLIENPSVRKAFGKNGRAIVEDKFDMNKNYAKLETQLIKALEAKPLT